MPSTSADPTGTVDAGLAVRRPLSGLDWPLPNVSGPIEMRLSDWRGRTRGSAMPASVLSKKARKPLDRCELMDGWLRWLGRWALVGSERGIANEDGLEGDLVREEAKWCCSRAGGGLAVISGNGDERDDLDVAAI